MIPLIKNNNADASLCSNYRCITLSLVLSKLFEYAILCKFGDFFCTDDLQFGFKDGIGCSDAIFTVKSVIDNFVKNGSTVTVSALDISKAFDKVSHYALYTKLLERNVPKILVDILISWYSKCYACVKWDGAMSSFFKIPAGVRQGGVLSPILFSIYMEILLKDLRKSRKGCIMKGQ